MTFILSFLRFVGFCVGEFSVRPSILEKTGTQRGVLYKGERINLKPEFLTIDIPKQEEKKKTWSRSPQYYYSIQ